MSKSDPVLIDSHPGRNAQAYGIARELGTDMDLIHKPSVGVVGNKGDSQCYIGVQDKVEAIHNCLLENIGSEEGKLAARLVQPEYTVATSDGIRNGTREMRYSLIGREVTQDSICEHLSASGLAGTIAVVACDKPPVGTLAALLEHNQPGIMMSDGSIHPAIDFLLVCDQLGRLGTNLDQCLFHLLDNQSNHLFRIFRLIQYGIDIRVNDVCESRKNTHVSYLFN